MCLSRRFFSGLRRFRGLSRVSCSSRPGASESSRLGGPALARGPVTGLPAERACARRRSGARLLSSWYTWDRPFSSRSATTCDTTDMSFGCSRQGTQCVRSQQTYVARAPSRGRRKASPTAEPPPVTQQTCLLAAVVKAHNAFAPSRHTLHALPAGGAGRPPRPQSHGRGREAHLAQNGPCLLETPP